MSLLNVKSAAPKLETVTVKDFMKSHNYVQVNKEVGVNVNGYPFVTFIDSNNESENIYFSKKAALTVKAGQPIIKGFFDGFNVAEVTNEAGEQRLKIVSLGESTRLELEDLF